MGCCFCPEGSCPPDCPYLEVFPSDSPYRTLEELNETGFRLEFIKECLLKAETADEQKTIVRGMILSGETRKKYPLEGDAAIFRLYDESLAMKKRRIEEIPLLNAKLQELTERLKLRKSAADASSAAVGKDVPPKDD